MEAWIVAIKCGIREEEIGCNVCVCLCVYVCMCERERERERGGERGIDHASTGIDRPPTQAAFVLPK